MIITNNEAALRIKCENVTKEEIGNLIEALENELKHANYLGKNGIGLAAPQIGIAKNIAIIRIGQNKINLINPKILNAYDPAIFRNEGCLSFPGLVEDTNRFQEIKILNEFEQSFVATGFLSIACQHEIDHLNSSLFFDHKIKKQEPIQIKNKVGPNNPCICGSNKKYKKCCGK